MTGKEISDKLTELGYSITSNCTNPGDYKTASDWMITVTGPNGRTFQTKYNMGCAHRVWKKRDGYMPLGYGQINKNDYEHGRIGKPGERIDYNKKKTLFQVALWENYTEPSQPDLVDVIYCLTSDANCVRYGQSFEDFASELGYDEDSRSAERTYNACRDIWSSLIRIGVNLDELTDLFQDY